MTIVYPWPRIAGACFVGIERSTSRPVLMNIEETETNTILRAMVSGFQETAVRAALFALFGGNYAYNHTVIRADPRYAAANLGVRHIISFDPNTKEEIIYALPQLPRNTPEPYKEAG